jgi:ATP-dependent DNA helicase RecG
LTQEELKKLFVELKTLPSETEWVEFKEAKSSFGFKELGQYFSALSNEANLKGQPYGWLIFSVSDKTREIAGTGYRPNRSDLDSLKSEIANKTTNRITFIEIYELLLPEGRVIMFQIPAAPQGIPIAWEGHYYGRDGESIGALNLQDIDRLLLSKLPDILDEKQKLKKINNLLNEMSRKDKTIRNSGTKRTPVWVLT